MKSASLRSAAFVALFYGVNAVYQGYISKFYQQQGISHGALTLLLVCFPVISMFSLPFWGARSDRSARPRRVLQSAVLLAALAALLWPGGRLVPAGIAFACCYPAVQPLADSLILQSLQAAQKPYGPVRLAGSAAFAAVNLLYGRLLRDDYSPVPWSVCAGLAALLLAAFLLPCGERKTPPAKAPLRKLLTLPHMRPLLLLFMLLQLTLGVFYNFFSIYFTALPGAGSAWLGRAFCLSALSEIPFLLLGDRLFTRWGPGPLLLAAALIMSLRYLLLGLASSLPLALASQALHGGGFVVITFAMARYVAREADAGLRARGQTLLSVAGFGLSRACGILLGGFLNAGPGLKTGFLLLAAMALGGFCAFLPWLRRAR